MLYLYGLCIPLMASLVFVIWLIIREITSGDIRFSWWWDEWECAYGLYFICAVFGYVFIYFYIPYAIIVSIYYLIKMLI